MKTVAILGGGPAGTFAAERLAKSGIRTIVFDEKLAWEKPCGGGLTYKAYHQYPYLIENDTPKKLISETTLADSEGGAVRLNLTQPLVIYSRLHLNKMLLQRAELAGAEIEQSRVLRLDRANSGWRLKTQHGTAEADFCIVATGARNSLRDVGTRWTAADTMLALGYYVPSEQEHIDIQFLPQIEGYIWVFPRLGHCSVGICGKGVSAQTLRSQLERYMAVKGLSRQGATFYSHVLPSLDTANWGANRVSGEGWMAAGDAAGLVDPITGEGLYYAMRSGALASQVLLMESKNPAAIYSQWIAKEFAHDLAFGARLAKRVFLERFLFSSVPVRMIQLLRRSPRFREIMQDLFAGTQPYLGLKDRLLANLHGTIQDVAMNFCFNKLIPNQSRIQAR